MSSQNEPDPIVTVDAWPILPDQFAELLDPKSPEKLALMGGVPAILEKLKTDGETGLKTAPNPNGQDEPTDVSSRKAYYGVNELPPPREKGFFEFVWDAMHDKILILLTVAAVVEIGIGIYKTVTGSEKYGYLDGVAVAAAVLIVVLVSSINDYRKQAQFRKLNDFGRSLLTCKVIRDSITVSIPVKELVVGDILIVEGGDVLPADGLFVSGFNVQCDESAQTGEPMGISKSATKDPFFLSGTKVVNGVGRMVVIGVGPNSVNGRSLLALEVEPDGTPLQAKLAILADQIAKMGGGAALLMIVILIILYFALPNRPTASVDVVKAITDIFVSAVTLVVVAVPEGLPLAVTLSLAFATIRMLKDNNLVRHLMACETMGNATTICSDKTGTLTLNRMTVVRGVYAESEFMLEDIPDKLLQTHSNVNQRKMLELFSTSVNINSTAEETTNDKGVRDFIGSKTEVALLQFTQKLGFGYATSREKTTVVEVYPFNSERKRMATVVKLELDEEFRRQAQLPIVNQSDKSSAYFLFNKGASEIILKSCKSYVNDNGMVCPLDDTKRNEFEAKINRFASEALRTIALAFKPVSGDDFQKNSNASNEDDEPPTDNDNDLDDLILFGIVGIQDPLRPEVPDAVASCQRAGITVRMVTGDNLATARAIARGCGILTKDGLVMEGPQFRQLTEDELDDILPNLQVLARSSPHDKQILVNNLRRLGETVAVTGDGTNDAPALKSADVGFSMGIAGTEVAKEASDIVLMDDNFASLVKAVIWGRLVYDSVRKFLQFQLTVNISAVVITIATSIISLARFRVPISALTAVQLLWVNLIMDTFAALALATDPATPDLLNRNPSSRLEPLVSFHMWRQIIGQAIYQIAVCMFIYLDGNYLWPEKARLAGGQGGGETGLDLHTAGVIFNTFVFMQIFNMINARSLAQDYNIFRNAHKNFYLITIWGGIVLVQALIVQFAGIVFKTDINGLDGYDWLICLGFGCGSIILGFIIRLIPDWRKELPASEKPVVYLSPHGESTTSLHGNGAPNGLPAGDKAEKEPIAIAIGADKEDAEKPLLHSATSDVGVPSASLSKSGGISLSVSKDQPVAILPVGTESSGISTASTTVGPLHPLSPKRSFVSHKPASPRISMADNISIVEIPDGSGLTGLVPQPLTPDYGKVLTTDEYRSKARAGWNLIRQQVQVVGAFKSSLNNQVKDESDLLPRRNSRGGKELWKIARQQTLPRVSVVQAFRRARREDYAVMQLLDSSLRNDAKAAELRRNRKSH